MNRQELLQHIQSLKSRGEIKYFGKQLDTQPELLAILILELRRRGEELQNPVKGKKLIRQWLGRSESAQVRTNPIHIDEAFVCLQCNENVPLGSIMIRDHCPYCLFGVHLDNIPGDRAANCGGLMIPFEMEVRSSQAWLLYRCTLCKQNFRVRTHPDDDLSVFKNKL